MSLLHCGIVAMVFLLVGSIQLRANQPARQIVLHAAPPMDRDSPQWGADIKLTLKPLAESPQAAEVMTRFFADEGYRVLRLPIYAMRPVDDPIYDQVIAMAKLAREIQPDVILFASVANGDGDQNNWLHHRHKFPPEMLGGDGDIYDLRLDVYARYLDAWIERLAAAGVALDWLGPFNEDNASARDYRRLREAMRADDTGELKVIGLETWALRHGVNTINRIAPEVDLLGSHFFDDREGKRAIPRAKWQDMWLKLVRRAKDQPIWFTEATRYREHEFDRIDETVAALERLLPALNAGVDGVIFYQTAPRIVNYANEPAGMKHSAFLALMESTREAKLRQVRHHGGDHFWATAFLQSSGVTVWHVVNSGAQAVSVRLEETGAVVRARHWSARSIDVDLDWADRSPEQLELPANSYTVITTAVPLS